MANKYIRHGETYCGDGTTSAAATSNGGVGAWNNINVLEGTTPAYGALVAGDVVYIRSKDAAGADITRTISANTSIGSAAATSVAQIAWVVDDGTTWAGISGVLKYVRGASVYISILGNNNFVAIAQDALFFDDSATTWAGSEAIRLFGNVKNGKFVSGDTNSNFPLVMSNGLPGKPPILENPTIQIARGNSARIVAGGHLRLIGPSIEIIGTQTGQYLISVNAEWGPSQIEIFGGKIFGAGASSNTTVFQIAETTSHYAATKCLIYGTSIPRSMPVSNYAFNRNGRIEIVGLDGGIGSHLEEIWGWATSRTDNNPPVIEATLPDASLTKWAWRVYPKAADYQKPVRLPSLKMFTDTAAAKTVTLEFLLANTMSANKKSIWATVQYTDDSTGNPKSISTQDLSAGALDTSTVGWSASTWGMISLLKKKLSITTPTAIKQNTPIFVTFYCAVASASDQDILFVDSDFALT